jgi:arylsulfatase A-like enzyme
MAGALLAAMLLAATCGACRRSAESRPDVVLVVIDTLRADHLGLQGYGRPTSPGLDALAGRAIVYDTAVATAPMTMPSMAALLSGRFGDRVGVSSHSRRDRLAGATTTLAEAAQAAGYRTVAVVANPWLARADSGFAQGFDRYLTRRSIADAPAGRLSAGVLTDAAIAAVAEDDVKPLLLWVHYIDAHMPYEPPRAHAAAMGNPSATSAVVQSFKARGADLQAIYFEQPHEPSDLDATVRLYDGAIHFVDEQITRLRSALASRSRPALTIVTADHGESLGDHGLYFAHDFTLYDELLHVPLLLQTPDRASARVTAPVSLLDVFPTICALTEIPCPPALDGDMLPVADARSVADERRALFAAGPPKRARYARDPWILLPGFAGRWTMVRRGSTKLLRIPSPQGTRWRAYDLDADPHEAEDVFEAPRHDALRTALERWSSEMDAARQVQRRPPVAFDERTREELRELGYLD